MTLARGELATLPPGTSKGNVAIFGLECAKRLPKDGAASDAGGPKDRKALLDELADAIMTLASDDAATLLADDRSALYEAVVEHRKEVGDKDGAKKAARAWATFLDKEATAAADPAARAVFDAHRMLAYAELGELDKAAKLLERSEKDFPGDYNPPARLAWVNTN